MARHGCTRSSFRGRPLRCSLLVSCVATLAAPLPAPSTTADPSTARLLPGRASACQTSHPSLDCLLRAQSPCAFRPDDTLSAKVCGASTEFLHPATAPVANSVYRYRARVCPVSKAPQPYDNPSDAPRCSLTRLFACSPERCRSKRGAGHMRVGCFSVPALRSCKPLDNLEPPRNSASPLPDRHSSLLGGPGPPAHQAFVQRAFCSRSVALALRFTF